MQLQPIPAVIVNLYIYIYTVIRTFFLQNLVRRAVSRRQQRGVPTAGRSPAEELPLHQRRVSAGPVRGALAQHPRGCSRLHQAERRGGARHGGEQGAHELSIVLYC